MTFLEIVKRTRQECGISGTGPITTVNQTGEMKRLVDWCSQAWIEIQEERQDFDFLRLPVSFNTVAGQQVYTQAQAGITDYAQWKNDSFRAYLLSAGVGSEIFLTQWDKYTDFRDYYLYSSRRSVTNRPTDICITPEKYIILGFTPNDVYVVSGEYYRTPQILAADGDVPLCPSRFHMAIVYKAMMKYGLFEVANEQIQAGRDGYTSMLNKLKADQTPMITMGASLI